MCSNIPLNKPGTTDLLLGFIDTLRYFREILSVVCAEPILVFGGTTDNLVSLSFRRKPESRDTSTGT